MVVECSAPGLLSSGAIIPTAPVSTEAAQLHLSIVIPYKQRLDNISAVFASLADQTLDGSQFEVVVGVMECSAEYVAACREFTDRITIVSVMTAEDGNVCRARNLAMRQASGQVTVVLEADVVLPSGLPQDLHDRYFSQHRNACVLAQMIG
jgi:glycosyltransferase involved in cell wall biosynthesis